MTVITPSRSDDARRIPLLRASPKVNDDDLIKIEINDAVIWGSFAFIQAFGPGSADCLIHQRWKEYCFPLVVRLSGLTLSNSRTLAKAGGEVSFDNQADEAL